MLVSIDDRLVTAIAERRLISFVYDGRARVAEPHDYGVRNGAVQLLDKLQHKPLCRFHGPRNIPFLHVPIVNQVADPADLQAVDAVAQADLGNGCSLHVLTDAVKSVGQLHAPLAGAAAGRDAEQG